MGVEVKIQRSRMRELSKQGQRAAARRNLELAQQAEEIAKQLVPVKTGALRDSIHVEVNDNTGSATLVAGSDKVTYARHIEYGTRNMSPQPFMTPAVWAVRQATRNRSFRIYER